MGQHRLLRIASRGDRVIRFRELWPTDDDPFTADEGVILDQGRHLLRPDETIIDLNAYYQASEAQRGARALDAVS